MAEAPNPDRFPAIAVLLNRLLRDEDPELRALAENFYYDERPAGSGIDLYNRLLSEGEAATPSEWKDRHTDYFNAELDIHHQDQKISWTFRPENSIDWLRKVQGDLQLVRLENANWICDAAHVTFFELEEMVRKQHQGSEKEKIAAQKSLRGVCERWNRVRKKRPAFCTTWAEVADILDEDDWAERLRDRMGLGHLTPEIPFDGVGGESCKVVLMNYTVLEATHDSEYEGLVVPTILDGEMGPHFFPAPVPGPEADASYGNGGRTVNLTAVKGSNDYQFGCELLHPAMIYKPHHLLRTGVIDKPPGLELERARGYHLPWIRLMLDRQDFAPGWEDET